ncbi:MAG: asparaginase [Gemmatimonadota bacterium]
MTEPLEVRVLRGGRRESRHEVHAVAVRADGDAASSYGDPDLEAYWRSSMKPFQALPLVEDGVTSALKMTARELALCCASHVGSRAHLEVVRGLLARLELDEADLACGPHRPFDDDEADRILREGGSYGRLHNNCSGKHAGMLALSLHHGWGPDGYHAFDHPVQARIRSSLDRWIDGDVDSLGWGVDGCGVPTPSLPLRQMALACARLGRAARRAEDAPAAVVGAMTEHPHLVSGPGRPVTRIMEATSGRILAKEGAEGVFCMAVPAEDLGVALKVVDGAGRARTPAALHVLSERGVLGPEDEGSLEELRCVVLRNTRDEEVGRIVTSHAAEGAVR